MITANNYQGFGHCSVMISLIISRLPKNPDPEALEFQSHP